MRHFLVIFNYCWWSSPGSYFFPFFCELCDKTVCHLQTIKELLWNETLQTLDGFEAFWCDRSFFIESCERDTEMEQICETFSVLHTEKFAYYLCADTFETRSGSFPRSSSLCRQPPFDRCFQINADFHDAAARFQKVDEHRTDDLDSCQRYKLKSGIFSHFLKYADENYRNK